VLAGLDASLGIDRETCIGDGAHFIAINRLGAGGVIGSEHRRPFALVTISTTVFPEALLRLLYAIFLEKETEAEV